MNGKSLKVAKDLSVAARLAETGHGDKRVAVEVNRTIVPGNRDDEYILATGDHVEIVHAIGGG